MAPRKKAAPAVTPDADSVEVVLEQMNSTATAAEAAAVSATSSASDKRTVIFAALLGGASLHGALDDAVIESRMNKLLRIADIAVALLEKQDE